MREYVVGSAKFNEYYSRQFEGVLDAKEFVRFKDTLIEKLPVTFRINPGLSNHESLVKMFNDPNFIVDMAIEQPEDEKTEAIATTH